MLIFEDVSEEYSELPDVLKNFEEWKLKEFNSYKEAYVHLCLPKISGTLIRPRLVLWNPFDENYEDIEKMRWFHLLAMYGRKKNETEEDLRCDPDLFLVPIVIEKIILQKLTSKFNATKVLELYLIKFYFRHYTGSLGSIVNHSNSKISGIIKKTAE